MESFTLVQICEWMLEGIEYYTLCKKICDAAVDKTGLKLIYVISTWISAGFFLKNANIAWLL